MEVINTTDNLPTLRTKLNSNFEELAAFEPVFISSTTSVSDNNKWTKFATIEISTRYNDGNATLFFQSRSSSSVTPRVSVAMIRVKQQDAFGSDPYVSATIRALTDDIPCTIGYAITSNTPTTTVDFYLSIPTTYSRIDGFLSAEGGEGVITWFTQAGWFTSPANLVNGDNDSLTTASSLSGVYVSTSGDTINGPVTIIADTTAQLTVRRLSTGNRAELLSSSTANELYLRNSLSDGTTDGSIIIEGDNDRLVFRPGNTSGTRQQVWHNGNIPIQNSSSSWISFPAAGSAQVAFSFSVGSMYLLTARVLFDSNGTISSRSVTYAITIGGSSSSQQVFNNLGAQGYGTNYLTSITPNGSGFNFNISSAVLAQLNWGIMRLPYNLL
jgi:hypothetical protein